MSTEFENATDPKAARLVKSAFDKAFAKASERWYFTFGFSHTHPTTGEPLKNCYVVIDGDVNESREIMQRHFGLKWAFQYPSAEKAGVEKYGLERIDLPS